MRVYSRQSGESRMPSHHGTLPTERLNPRGGDGADIKVACETPLGKLYSTWCNEKRRWNG